MASPQRVGSTRRTYAQVVGSVNSQTTNDQATCKITEPVLPVKDCQNASFHIQGDGASSSTASSRPESPETCVLDPDGVESDTATADSGPLPASNEQGEHVKEPEPVSAQPCEVGAALGPKDNSSSVEVSLDKNVGSATFTIKCQNTKGNDEKTVFRQCATPPVAKPYSQRDDDTRHRDVVPNNSELSTRAEKSQPRGRTSSVPETLDSESSERQPEACEANKGQRSVSQLCASFEAASHRLEDKHQPLPTKCSNRHKVTEVMVNLVSAVPTDAVDEREDIDTSTLQAPDNTEPPNRSEDSPIRPATPIFLRLRPPVWNKNPGLPGGQLGTHPRRSKHSQRARGAAANPQESEDAHDHGSQLEDTSPAHSPVSGTPRPPDTDPTHKAERQASPPVAMASNTIAMEDGSSEEFSSRFKEQSKDLPLEKLEHPSTNSKASEQSHDEPINEQSPGNLEIEVPFQGNIASEDFAARKETTDSSKPCARRKEDRRKEASVPKPKNLLPDKSSEAHSKPKTYKNVVTEISNPQVEPSTRTCGLPPMCKSFFSLCGHSASISENSNNKHTADDITRPSQKTLSETHDQCRSTNKIHVSRRRRISMIGDVLLGKRSILGCVLRPSLRSTRSATGNSQNYRTRSPEADIGESIDQMAAEELPTLVALVDLDDTTPKPLRTQPSKIIRNKEHLLGPSQQLSDGGTNDSIKSDLPQILRQSAPLKLKLASVTTPELTKSDDAASSKEMYTKCFSPEQNTDDQQSQIPHRDSDERYNGLGKYSEVESFASVALASMDLSPRGWRVSSISSLPVMENSHAHPRKSSLQLILQPSLSASDQVVGAASLTYDNNPWRSMSDESGTNEDRSRNNSTMPVMVAKVSYELSHPQPSRAAAAWLLQVAARNKETSSDETERPKNRKDELSRESTSSFYTARQDSRDNSSS